MLATVSLLVWSLAAPVPNGPSVEVLAGSWWANGNGHYGNKNLEIDKDGTVSGTIFDQPIAGKLDLEKRTLTFRRLVRGKTGEDAAVQEYSGTLTQIRKSPAGFKWEGTFRFLAGPPWGERGQRYPWSAQAVRLRPPADDLQKLQGTWSIESLILSIDKSRKLPLELGLGEKGAAVEIRANELLMGGKKVASLANDLDSSSLQAEVGFPNFRPLIATLPDGKALVCSYQIQDSGVEICYPHTTSCHRGSGQVIYLKRPK